MKSFRAITAVGMAEKKNLEKKTSIAKEILGYLNFSSGTSDPHLYDLWNGLFFELEKEETDGLWNRGILFLRQILSDLRDLSVAKSDISFICVTIDCIMDHSVFDQHLLSPFQSW